MPPNHDLPIEKAGLWDIIDIRVMRQLAARAPKEPDHENPDHARTIMAKDVVDGISDGSDEDRFLKWARLWIGSGIDGTQRVRAGQLAQTCGAHTSRLIAYLNWKYGLFRRNYTR